MKVLTEKIKTKREKVLERNSNVKWMDTMVLNPAIIEKNGVLHMLFRATGTEVCVENDFGKNSYPICLGYGKSTNGGKTWEFDFSSPAIAPKCKSAQSDMYIENIYGERVVNYSNGCIEDPRLFYIGGECFMTVACRMFPPGAYWENDCPTQCAPEWINGEHPFGLAATQNVTVNVLYKVDIEALEKRDYKNAFGYITNLTNPDFGENRDVIFFPEKMEIDGKMQYVMIDRPVYPYLNPQFTERKPSIVISAAERFEDFAKPDLPRNILATPKYEWENNRVGASAPLLKIDNDTYLFSYHGKQDDEIGYTQSFMLLKKRKGKLPEIYHRSGERLITVSEDWEMPNTFKIPCIFVTGMIKENDELILSYGAADECCGLMKIPYQSLLEKLGYEGA